MALITIILLLLALRSCGSSSIDVSDKKDNQEELKDEPTTEKQLGGEVEKTIDEDIAKRIAEEAKIAAKKNK